MIENTYYFELMFILLNIFLAVEIDEKGHTDRDVLEKKLNCEFIRINTSKENCDADFGASRIQNFLSKFKDKEKENEIKKQK